MRAVVDGLSELFEYCTARSAASHWATVAVLPADERLITPVAGLYEPAMLPIVAGTLVKPSTSWPEAKLPVIDTVAVDSVALSGSATVMEPLIAAAAPFSV